MNREELSEIKIRFRKRRAALWGADLDELDTMQTVSEMLEYNWSNRICLFEFRGKWGFCLHVWPGDVAGEFYGAWLSVCDPYENRQTTLEAAVDRMLEAYMRSNRPEAKNLIWWAKSLITPQQLRLI